MTKSTSIKRMAANAFMLIVVIPLTIAFTIAVLMGCEWLRNAWESLSVPAENVKGAIDWDVSDSNALTNGNVLRAITALKDLQALEKRYPPAPQVLREPWRFYGQRVCIGGILDSLDMEPPDNPFAKELGAESAEIVYTWDRRVQVEALTKGAVSHREEGDMMKVCGYVVGWVPANPESGETTRLALVGELQ